MAPCRLTSQIATHGQVAGVVSLPEAPALQEVNPWGAEGGAGEPPHLRDNSITDYDKLLIMTKKQKPKYDIELSSHEIRNN